MNTTVIVSPVMWGVILFLQTLLALWIRYSLMTEKFFGDSLGILSIMQSGYFYEGSFDMAARFFYIINFFDIDTLLGWSVYIMALFFFINLYILKDIREVSVKNFFLLTLSSFLWYLFAAGITKEVVQTLFYLAIYIICVRNKIVKQSFWRVVFGVFVLILCAMSFRAYYIFMAFFSLMVYGIFKLILISRLKRHNSVLLLFVMCVCIWMVVLFGIKLLYEPSYDVIVNLRSVTYLCLQDNTDSFISDVFENSSGYISVYIVNYILNFIRLMFPIELFLIGKIQYIPFCIYMILLSSFLYKKTRNFINLDKQQMISLVFLWSFFIVSPIMEPDFGSWVRHQSVCWMLVKNLI